MGEAKARAAHVAATGQDWGRAGVRHGDPCWRWAGNTRVLTPMGHAVLTAFDCLRVRLEAAAKKAHRKAA